MNGIDLGPFTTDIREFMRKRAITSQCEIDPPTLCRG